MKKLIIAAAVAVVTTGCAGTAPKQITQVEPYVQSDSAWSREDGTATVKGAAIVRTRDGEVKTCAGLDVSLIPVSHYTMERMSIIYGTSDRVSISYRPTALGPIGFAGTNLAPAAPGAVQDRRSEVCDVDGEFEFEDVPTGEWYVVAGIEWQHASYMNNMFAEQHMQNAVLMYKVVNTEDGQTEKVMLR